MKNAIRKCAEMQREASPPTSELKIGSFGREGRIRYNPISWRGSRRDVDLDGELLPGGVRRVRDSTGYMLHKRGMGRIRPLAVRKRKRPRPPASDCRSWRNEFEQNPQTTWKREDGGADRGDEIRTRFTAVWVQTH
jgi:hypothetical protein